MLYHYHLLNELSWVDFIVRRKIHKLSLMSKMIFKLAPPYLCDLCPDYSFDGSCYSLCLFYVGTDRDNK